VATGGTPNTGGTMVAGQSGSGGGSNGGTASGGVGTGGMAGTGARASGGTATGGKAGTAGSSNGGAATGGKAGAGGSPNGGAGTGGKAGSGGGGTVSCSGPPLTGGTQRCSSNAQGNLSGGYTWTIWSSGTGGCMTPYGVGAAFKANWNNSGDFLARVGLNLGSNKPFTQFGTLSADYAQTKTGTAGGYSYIGIYGWSVNPLHEYYIIDDWYGTRPSFAGDKVGSVTVDGGTYDILTHTQVNQPAITGGNATFVQFWSLRTTARQCGHISITEHFQAWAAIGLTLGNMVEAKLLVEAGGGTGSIEFTSATITAQ
jgi:endo-1,4-beta-xylanase